MAPQNPNGFVVYSWTPEGRAVIRHEARRATDAPQGNLRVLLARVRRHPAQILAYLALLAFAGFSIGYAVQAIPG